MEPIRVAIIGLGDGGMCNLRGFGGRQEAHVTMVSDYSEKRLCEKELAVQAEAGLRVACLSRSPSPEMYDLMVVATPDAEHLHPAYRALAEGKFVFVEKPLDTNLKQLFKWKHLDREYPGKIIFSEKYSFARPIEALLGRLEAMGSFMGGDTSYRMWKCDRIMGDGKWRTEGAYNPVAGGLSHNWMTMLLIARSPIVRVMAKGHVLRYHKNLDQHGGYDAMSGLIEFASGVTMTWSVNLASEGAAPYEHRTVAHTLQFEKGHLSYSPDAAADCLWADLSGNKLTAFDREPILSTDWPDYNAELYRKMHTDTIRHISGQPTRHTFAHGLNVAAACALAMASAKADGRWMPVPKSFRF